MLNMRLSTYIIEFLVFTFVAYALLNQNFVIDVVASVVTIILLFLVFTFIRIITHTYRQPHRHMRRAPWWGNQGPNGPYERSSARRNRRYGQ